MLKFKKFTRDVFSFFDSKTKPNMAVELVGSNWVNGKDLPVAVLYGFNPWKRYFVSQYLKEYRVAFVKGKASFYRVKKTFINHLPEDVEIAFIGWSKKLPKTYHAYAKFKSRSIKVGYVEDGFLRSIGSGLLHTKPCSLAIDWKGMHFDSSVETDIEHLLKNYQLTEDQVFTAKKYMQIYKSARLTKYYQTKPYDKDGGLFEKRRHTVLVLGQVEDDASVLNSKGKVKSNSALIEIAVKENPGSDIIYRPHPDYYYETRKSKKIKKEFLSSCLIVPPDSSLYELFDRVDQVYTISSLSGLEALLYGLDVRVLGTPFYSGWGLTKDDVKIARRDKELSLEELFYISYFVYPRYMGLETDGLINFEDLVSEFVVESLKHERVLELKSNKLYSRLLQAAGNRQLGVSFDLLKYIVSTNSFSAGSVEEAMQVIENGLIGKPYLYGYSQISVVLMNSANYDCLVEYTNRCLASLSSDMEKYSKNTGLVASFFYSLSIVIYRTYGRPISEIPDINQELLALSGFHKSPEDLLVNYFKCLIANLQYQQADHFFEIVRQKNRDASDVIWPSKNLGDVVEGLFTLEISANALKKMLSPLNVKPARSERNHVARHRLLEKTAHYYGDHLNKTHTTNVDFILNKVLVDVEKNAIFGIKSNLGAIDYILGAFSRDEKLQGRLAKKRLNDLIYVGSVLVKHGEVALAERFIPLFKLKSKLSFSVFKLQLIRAKGDAGEFYKFYDSLDSSLKNDTKVLGINALFLREQGMLNEAYDQYRLLESKPGTVAGKIGTKLNLDKVFFCVQASQYLNSVPQPKMPKGVIFIGSHTCFNTLAMMLPSYVELKKKGYAVINLSGGMTECQPVGIDSVDRFSGVIPMRFNHHRLNYDWSINWDERDVSAGGINFYQGFYEALSTFTRRYFVDLNIPEVNKMFSEKLYQCDLYLKVCNDIYDSLVKKGIPVAFVSGNSHVVPYSVMRDFARKKNDPNLSFINCNVAYEAYFSNLGSKFANTMCVTDMTLYPNVRAPFLARREKFEAWYEKNKDSSVYLDKANELIKVNRVGSSDDSKEKELINRIILEKKAGKKIVCAFGKVPVDLCVPYDGGPAHRDMSDWITHTVQLVGRSEDILLLVKPHPHELRPEISRDLVESFSDLIKVDIPDNVVVLGHKDINGHALAPYLDLAILYVGSSALELTAQGVPVMLTSYFGRHDYPVGMNYPSSRSDYERYLLSGNYLVPDHEVRKQAAFLMCYLGTEEISTINQYSLRALTNDGIGVPRWRKKAMENFLSYGDPAMRKIADQIVEKFEVN